MSERNDLTRWNRAGLARFRYVDGNAIEYLEMLRQQLVKRFVDPKKGESTWLKPEELTPANEKQLENETLIQRQQRLSRKQERIFEMYQQDRRDWAWEITRTFSRASHILMEHTNAYANEGYLGTATQWDHVRRLIEMLDYHPAPPASASTTLVFVAKEKKNGIISQGFQVKYSPAAGGAKVIFETLEDLLIDSALNELRPKGWNQSDDPALPSNRLSHNKHTKKKNLPVFSGSSRTDSKSGSVATFWRAKRKPKVEAEQVVMIFRALTNKAEAATVDRIDEINGGIHLLPSRVQNSWGTWPKSEATLLVSPRWQRTCWLNGDNVIRTEEPHGFNVGAFISWKLGDGWKFAKVVEADKRNLRLELAGALPGQGVDLFEARSITSNILAANLEAIGMLVGELPEIKEISFGESVGPEPSELEKPFTINPPDYTSSPPDALSPPGGLSFGSFLFPTPMLPMDLVKMAVDLMLTMGVMVVPSTGEIVFKSLPDITMPTASDLFDVLGEIPNVEWNAAYSTDAEKIAALDTMLNNLPEPPPGEPKVQFKEVLAELEKNNPLIAISKDSSAKAVTALNEPRYIVDGGPGRIEYGEWLVGKFTDGLRAVKISDIKEHTDSDKSESFSLSLSQSLENLDGNVGELQKLYADFRGELIAEGAAINTTPIDPIKIELENVPESLKVGRNILLTAKGKKPISAKIESIVGTTIKTNPPATGFSKGDLIIRGNVVDAGHGAVMPVKILGSGDAAKSNQAFTLEVENVSFTPDATKRSGVAAAIDVDVAGRIWEQVSTLKDSTSGDHHYVIRMTEEGYVKILFGDGEYGRRLPSGKNNIRIRYRIGSGLAGNVPVGGLEKPVNPHPLIDMVRQPLPATGGGDMEDVAALRENAPSTLLALERAVSLSDFSHLAAAQSSVWQAKAYSQILHGGRTESVKIVIVPAGGVQAQSVEDAIESFLQKHALPGVQVTVENFKSVLFDLSVIVRVKTDEFVAETVEKTIVSALSDHFTLKNRKLGQHLYLSEAYKVVEKIQGVENSICVLNDDNTMQLIRADDENKVVYLNTEADENPSTLNVIVEEYLP